MARRVAAILIPCLLTAVASLGGAVWSARPRRFSEPLVGRTRTQVHALLGVPDADFMPKGWEGWDQPVLVGAWVLVVSYDDAEQVVATRVRFDWGLGYLGWDRSPARVATRPPSPSPSPPAVQ